jgi:hypothetical protein
VILVLVKFENSWSTGLMREQMGQMLAQITLNITKICIPIKANMCVCIYVYIMRVLSRRFAGGEFLF